MAKKSLYSLLQKTKLLLTTLPGVHKKLLLIISIIIGMLLLWPTSAPDSGSSTDNIRTRIELNVTTPQNVANNSTVVDTNSGNNNASTDAAKKAITVAIKTLDPDVIDGSWHEHEIHKGDSVYRIFRQYDIPTTVLHELIALKPAQQDITAVVPGQTLAFYISAQGQLIQLRISSKEHATAIFMLREDGSYNYQYQ